MPTEGPEQGSGESRPVTKHEIDERETALINTILLWRIYDAITVLISLNDPDTARRMALLHEEGEFIGPNPAYKESPNE
jgi:hypothetical protein